MQKVLFQQRYGLGRPGALGSTLAVAGATGVHHAGGGAGAGACATSAAGATYPSSAGCCLR